MREPTYSPHFAALLAASRQRADTTEQTARQRATTCGWCGASTETTPLCGAEPWSNQ